VLLWLEKNVQISVPPCLRISAAEPLYQGPQQYQVRIDINPLYIKQLDLSTVADPGCLSWIHVQKDSGSRIRFRIKKKVFVTPNNFSKLSEI
jgi:hypothetical protein